MIDPAQQPTGDFDIVAQQLPTMGVDRVASFNVPLASADFATVKRVFDGLEKEALDVLRLTGAEIESRIFSRTIDAL